MSFKSSINVFQHPKEYQGQATVHCIVTGRMLKPTTTLFVPNQRTHEATSQPNFKEISDQANKVEDLERILSDASARPVNISYSLIELITKKFSQEIGTGAFGVVYLGSLQNGMVAVKKLSTRNDFSNKLFLDEFNCLKKVKHKNIVRFLGYCAYTLGQVMEIKGEAIIIDEAHKKFLCFEYAPNGNLQHYLKEKTHGYEWNMRYQIIKGICQGLGYLHQEHIYHLDLKPANVLLGAKMEPKITDFGLSRCNDGKQSTIFTTNVGGTPGYMAPELIDNQQISCKTDIFSLGIIMIKILTQSDETPTENWHESLDGDCKLLKKCIEIARSCCDHDPHSRPTIHNIILMLDETETMIQMIPPSINTEPRNDPMSSLYQVVQRFRALPERTINEHSRLVAIYEDLNALEHILEGRQKPNNLSYSLLQFMTKNFSVERKMGNNEFGDFFKGILQVVAIVRLSGSLKINDRMFHGEVKITMTAQHQNIVRFLGNCSYAAKEEASIHGKTTNTEIRERLLCFEYLSNGSLKKHISDELRGLHWDTRFQIIKGICQGLCYLHKEKHIIHMDLKPSNILLDDRMVPKITGFGISELITVSDRSLQWVGYSAPECTDVPPPHKRDIYSDIYSLGVIIRELVTGSKEKPNIFGVLRKWKHRWNKSGKRTPLWYHQVHKCLELALKCLHRERNRRPPICSIIHELNELDNNTNISIFDQKHPLLKDMIEIEPLELHFPYEHNKAITRTIELINDTDDYFAFRITTSSSLLYRTQPSKNIVPPRSKCSVNITLQAPEMTPEQCNYGASQFYVESTRVDESLIAEDITEDMFDEKPGKVVDKVDLIVVLE